MRTQKFRQLNFFLKSWEFTGYLNSYFCWKSYGQQNLSLYKDGSQHIKSWSGLCMYNCAGVISMALTAAEVLCTKFHDSFFSVCVWHDLGFSYMHAGLSEVNEMATKSHVAFKNHWCFQEESPWKKSSSFILYFLIKHLPLLEFSDISSTGTSASNINCNKSVGCSPFKEIMILRMLDHSK